MVIPRDQIVKPLDAWWTVLFVDPVATRAIPVLAGLQWVTPTRVTLLAHVLGIVSAVLFATDDLLAGGLVFEMRFVLDCIDGKLARATGRSSLSGQLLDTVGDRVVFMANVVALGWSRASVPMIILVGAYPLLFHLMDTRKDLRARSGSTAPIERILGGTWGQALARRRLLPFPTSVDVEHLLLFIGPVAWTAGIDLLTPLLWLTAGYFVIEASRYSASILRLAAEVDRANLSAIEGRAGPPSPLAPERRD